MWSLLGYFDGTQPYNKIKDHLGFGACIMIFSASYIEMSANDTDDKVLGQQFPESQHAICSIALSLYWFG